MNSLVHLNHLATPLTPADLEATNGAILPVIAMFVAGFGAGFGGAALWDLATG